MNEIENFSKKSNSSLYINDPQKLEEILSSATDYYNQTIGLNIIECPITIRESEKYINASLTEVIQAGLTLNIDFAKELHLMWIARMFLAVDLPDSWVIKANEQGIIQYFNSENEIFIDVHPGSFFFNTLIDKSRKRFSKIEEDIQSKLKR